MTQEEKARAYDEALEVMRQWIAPCHTKEQLDTLKKSVFPELKESEDERMVRAIEHILYENYSDAAIIEGVEIAEIVAWLEKQKEQKQEWKPKPESLEALMYAIEGKWDAISPTSYLSRRLEDLYEGLVNTFNVDESLLAELPKVASRAYTAEGIEELRELKRKIETSMEQKPAEWSDYKDKVNVPYCSSEPEWSDEDEKMRDLLIESLDDNSHYFPFKETKMKMIDWLKSLRPSWKPSEEQLEAAQYVSQFDYGGHKAALVSLYEQLKKLM